MSTDSESRAPVFTPPESFAGKLRLSYTSRSFTVRCRSGERGRATAKTRRLGRGSVTCPSRAGNASIPRRTSSRSSGERIRIELSGAERSTQSSVNANPTPGFGSSGRFSRDMSRSWSRSISCALLSRSNEESNAGAETVQPAGAPVFPREQTTSRIRLANTTKHLSVLIWAFAYLRLC